MQRLIRHDADRFGILMICVFELKLFAILVSLDVPNDDEADSTPQRNIHMPQHGYVCFVLTILDIGSSVFGKFRE